MSPWVMAILRDSIIDDQIRLPVVRGHGDAGVESAHNPCLVPLVIFCLPQT